MSCVSIRTLIFAADRDTRLSPAKHLTDDSRLASRMRTITSDAHVYRVFSPTHTRDDLPSLRHSVCALFPDVAGLSPGSMYVNHREASSGTSCLDLFRFAQLQVSRFIFSYGLQS